jgi:hypothetical protein
MPSSWNIIPLISGFLWLCHFVDFKNIAVKVEQNLWKNVNDLYDHNNFPVHDRKAQ